MPHCLKGLNLRKALIKPITKKVEPQERYILVVQPFTIVLDATQTSSAYSLVSVP